MVVLTKETLREALHITPVNNNQAFAAPPSINGLIDFVNQLGYPKLEEFTQSIHTFIEDRRNLSRHTSEKKRATLIVIPSIRFTKLIIHHLQRSYRFHLRPNSPLHLPNEEPVLGYLKFSAKGTKREVFGMPIHGSLITTEIQHDSYYREYLEKVAQHRRYLAGETGGVQDPPALKPTQPARKPKTTAPKAPSRLSVSIPVRLVQPAPTSAPAKLQEKKRKQATETSDKPLKEKKSKHGWGKAKVTEKQVTHDLLSLQSTRRQALLINTYSKGESLNLLDPPNMMNLYMLCLDSQTARRNQKRLCLGLKRVVKMKVRLDQTGSDAGAQAEDQTGSDDGAQAEGQAGSNPDETSEGQ
nr:histone deacetylase 14 [Tanacetum cinerariifolium]